MPNDRIDSLTRDLGDLIAKNSRWLTEEDFELACLRALLAYLPQLDEPMTADDAVEAFDLALNGTKQ